MIFTTCPPWRAWRKRLRRRNLPPRPLFHQRRRFRPLQDRQQLHLRALPRHQTRPQLQQWNPLPQLRNTSFQPAPQDLRPSHRQIFRHSPSLPPWPTRLQIPKRLSPKIKEEKEALIDKILAAANAHLDEIPALEEEIRTQSWFDAGTGQLALDAVRAQKTTADEVRTMLGSRYGLATPEKAWARVESFGRDVADGATTGTDRLWKDAKSLGEGIADEATTEAGRLWEEAKSFGQGVADEATTEAGRLWEETKSFGQGVADGAATGADRIWEEAKSFGQGVADGATTGADRIWEEAKSFGQGVADGAATATDPILDDIAWLIGKAESPERDALVEEVIRAGSLKSDQELYELRQNLWKQTWFNPTTAMSVLSGILDRSTTPEDARAQLGGGLTREQVRERLDAILQNGAEFFKGTASTAVTETGRIIEGTGQLLSSPLSKEEQALVDGIAGARNLKPDELALLKQQILEHGLFVHPRTANAILQGVLEGKITPDQARERLSPLFSDVFKGIQSYGEQLGDYGKTLFPAAPGYENSFGRQLGEMVGSNLPGITATLALGPEFGLAVEMLRGAGDGAAAAREAGKPEDEQTTAAMLYSMTALSDKIPAGKLAAPLIERLTQNPLLQQFLKQAIQEGAAQTFQQLLQNFIKRQWLDKNQEVLDKLLDTSKAGAGLGLLKTLLDILIHIRGSARASALVGMLQPDGAELARQTIGEISLYAQASKTRTRSGDNFYDFVSTATAGTLADKLSVPADAFVRHFVAADVDPHELADSHGMTRHALDMAQATGGDIRIPTATYATYFAGSKHDPFLMDNMRFQPGALTAAEAKVFREQGDAHSQAANSEAKRLLAYALTNHAAERRVYHQVASRARAAGRPEETAARYAMTYPALYSTMAASDGLSLDEYLNRYPLS
jgi:cell division septum initiation protein DivIVA